jgi:hypothetical protein
MGGRQEYMKKYCEDHKEQLAAYSKARYEANKETISQKQKEYREANRELVAAQRKIYYEANKETLLENNKEYRKRNKEKISERSKEYRIANIEKELARSRNHYYLNREKYIAMERQRYEANKEKHLEQSRAWAEAHPEKRLEISRKYNRKLRSTPKGNLSSTISKRMNESLRKGMKAGRHWEALVDFSVDQLKTHLEKLFQPGMTWGNYGTVWHIDHKIPVAAFNFESPDDIDFKVCWSLKNLQPLDANKNMSKRDKVEKPFQPALAIAV